MDLIKTSNLALRFLLELCALAALGYWGVHAGQTLPLKIALGLGGPLLLAVVWGMFVAPKAAIRLPQPATYLLGLLILELTALVLGLAGQRPLAIVYAAIIALNAGLMLAWQQFGRAAGSEPGERSGRLRDRSRHWLQQHGRDLT